MTIDGLRPPPSCARSSARSTSTCSISCCGAGSTRGGACSTPAAAPAATCRTSLARGFDVYAIDEDPGAIAATRELAAALAPRLPADNIRQGAIHALPWLDGRMDAVVCSAVLHFARDRVHFERMVGEMWRVLAGGGLFFARLASSIGIEPHLTATIGRVRLPDGSERFVVDEPFLLERPSDSAARSSIRSRRRTCRTCGA